METCFLWHWSALLSITVHNNYAVILGWSSLIHAKKCLCGMHITSKYIQSKFNGKNQFFTCEIHVNIKLHVKISVNTENITFSDDRPWNTTIGPKVYVSPCQYVHLTKHILLSTSNKIFFFVMLKHMLEINLRLFKLQVKLRTI